ncbi:uncharacterized protein LOC143546513 [Bidens hawaiensis]|uniref:uncharacterized protein LOC143546513 n=1 Tax=Bidens hawaiensis TaxID=980011 RepID=UPI00404B0ED6
MESTSSSSDDKSCSYDVFLSFRGEDTRHSFTDHLYHKLTQAGIYAFRDDEEIKRGEELKPEIQRAIKASKASVVVISENYATSSWCLEELVLILQQRRVFSHFVLPIFYHVNTADVRKHKGNFAVENERWKTALTEVANLSGFTLSGPETKTLKEIVDTVYDRLDQKEVHVPLNIIGMASRYEEINSWLDQCDVEFLAIYGMGGSGKTTLAKYIYNLHRRTFEYVSFVEDIGSRCKTYNDLLELQKQFLKDIIGGEKRNIPGISRGMRMIEEVLQQNKTLIVLDDIIERSQLVKLLGTGKINAQSKIIITTRENVDNWFDIPHWRCQKYEMRLLNDDESLELLCCHAFRSEIQHEGYGGAIKYCEGNPLALEVMGSSLSKYNAHMIMPSQLRLYEIDMDSRIQSVLQRSFLSLPSYIVKELFLHIACFFIGMDIDYVVKILEPDYAAQSGIETLLEKCLLTISPNKKLMMHRLLQEMAKNIVRQESTKLPAKRSRVWLSSDSYKILSKGKGSNTVEGLALDIKILEKENFAFKSSELKTDAIKNMEILKLLQLNFAKLSGSYENFSEDLRWLCWFGFNLRTIPSELYMGHLVAVDMSNSNLEVFEPPMVLQSMQILNLKDSHNLVEIRNIFKIPHLETLVLWNCYSLVNVCKTIEELKSLTLLNMTGCKNLFNRRQGNLLATSSSSGVVNQKPILSFPFSLHRLFLKDCNLECSDSFPLSFSVQPYLQYLNLCNSLFESLPCYNHLENLRVLDLSFCSKLKCLLCLPSTLAELYTYYCESLEKITFQSHRFPLQEFGYEGCVNLYEIEDYIKLVPINKLTETDLGHMKWLKEYQNHQVRLVGDELTVGRSRHIQMLYEFNIISTSLPDINDPNMRPMFISESSSLSFDIPSCPKNKRLEGVNVSFKYSVWSDDWVWFCKISTTNGVVDLVYNPKVFGKPESGEVCIWLSYWPIGNTFKVGDTVNVYIVAMSGLEAHECGVSLVYSDKETLERDTGWAEILGGDLSGFQLSTGAYYLCRRDFFSLMEVGRLTTDWFRILAGDVIDYSEVRGWRKTGRSKHVISPFTELKTIRCIINGPQLEDVYNIAEMSKSSIGDKTVAFTSSFVDRGMKSYTRSQLIDEAMEEIFDKQYDSGDDEITMEEADPPFHEVAPLVKLSSQTERHKMMTVASALDGIESIAHDKKVGKLIVTGDALDQETSISRTRKIANIDVSSAGPVSERLARIRNSTTGEVEKLSSLTSAHPCHLFSLAEIISATNNFDDDLVIGWGVFGNVYKGQISSEGSGHVVAIKRLDSTYGGELEFWAEIDILCNFHHRHLVSLVGYCNDDQEKILVYEYMTNGSLSHHLHNVHTTLSWETRLRIAVGVARVLDYLHTGVRARHGVIHRNVTSASILLDENWAAVISGLGLSMTGPTDHSMSYGENDVKGTLGYIDPEYYMTGILTYKTDVYSFGVVLFELLSGRPAVDMRYEEEASLVTWAKKCVKQNKIEKMIDSNIKGTVSTKCIRRFTKIAERCLHAVSKERPTMSELVASLEALLDEPLMELHEKSNHSAKSSCTMGFPCKIHKYLLTKLLRKWKFKKQD